MGLQRSEFSVVHSAMSIHSNAIVLSPDTSAGERKGLATMDRML